MSRWTVSSGESFMKYVRIRRLHPLSALRLIVWKAREHNLDVVTKFLALFKYLYQNKTKSLKPHEQLWEANALLKKTKYLISRGPKIYSATICFLTHQYLTDWTVCLNFSNLIKTFLFFLTLQCITFIYYCETPDLR